jgi:hypothetical protein
MRIPVLIMLGASLMASACASTRITVTKVDSAHPNAKGIRFSLPKPFLLVTPNTSGDGGFKAEIIYLPDESNTYAIDAGTKLGKYSLNVITKDGLLSKVAWSRTDAAVAAESVRVSGELLKSRFELEQKEQDERDAKRKEEQKAAASEIKKLREGLAEQELLVKLAGAEVTSAEAAVKAGSTPETQAALRAAQLKEKQAELRRDAAQDALNSAVAVVSTTPFNEPTGDRPLPTAGPPASPTAGTPATAQPSGAPQPPAAPTTPRKKFWGPVLYTVGEDADGRATLTAVSFDLRSKQGQQVRTQVPFETVATPNTATPKVPSPVDPKPRGISWPASAATFSLIIEMTEPLATVDTVGRQLYLVMPDLTEQAVADNPLNVTLDTATKKSVTLTFTRKLDPGKYKAVVPFTYGTDGSDTITITVVVTQ